VPCGFGKVIDDAISAHGLDGRVTLTGVLVGEAKRRIFHDADIFCFPTFFASETFGLVVAEAMSCGLPVVATNWRGLRSVVDDGKDGFLVPPRDAAALAERIAVLLLDAPLRERMGAAGRRKYEAMFTPRAFAQRMRSELDAFAATVPRQWRSAGSEPARARPSLMATIRSHSGPEGSTLPTVNIVGARISAINLDRAAEIIEAWIDRGERQYVCVADVHAIMQGHWDASLRAVQHRAGLITPDGMPLVWASRLAGHKTVRRVYGPDLMLHLCRHGASRGRRHFFYGGARGVTTKLAERLTARIPGLVVCGTLSPPHRALTPEEDSRAIAAINSARPDIVWVGLGAPKQDWWMADHRARLDAPVLIGVGAAFDFLSGTKRQAPLWMQRAGLEWTYRLATEPRRLWRRYLRAIPGFLILSLLQLIRPDRFRERAR
jgi:N-acetylglucosaminyldiphosphoundecaprenol N-acetyl-beta-D-mannosaminyltransferase